MLLLLDGVFRRVTTKLLTFSLEQERFLQQSSDPMKKSARDLKVNIPVTHPVSCNVL